MSRVVQLSLDEGIVVIRCHSENIGIETIERLSEGGVKVVCVSDEGAALIRRELEAYVMDAAPSAPKGRAGTISRPT